MSLTRAECERIAGDVKAPPDDLWRAVLATLLRLEARGESLPAPTRTRRGA